jgi:hypothetical protein
VVSLSNHGKAGAAVLRQAQDEGGMRGNVSPTQVNQSSRTGNLGAACAGMTLRAG